MGELAQILADYLKGAKELSQCAEWLAGVDWDDPDLTEEEKDSFGLFDLLITDVAQGLRDEQELQVEASSFVASGSRKMFPG